MVNLSQALRDQELQPFRERIRELEQQCSALRAEVKRMKPLVQATRTYVDGITNKDSLLRIVGPLIDATDEYEVELKLAAKGSSNGR
jgi:hypothetical protein